MKRLLLAVVAVAAMGLAWNLALADGPSHSRPIPVTTAQWSGGHAVPVTPVWYRGGWGGYGGYYGGYRGYYGYPGVAVSTPYFSYYSGAPAVTAYPSYGYTTPYYGYYGGYYPRYYGAYRPYYRTWR
jgi:hypothetical protein